MWCSCQQPFQSHTRGYNCTTESTASIFTYSSIGYVCQSVEDVSEIFSYSHFTEELQPHKEEHSSHFTMSSELPWLLLPVSTS